MPDNLGATFWDSDLRSLEWAYSRARKDLGIGQVALEAGVRREHLARIIFSLATRGERNPEAVRRRAVMLFANSSFGGVEQPSHRSKGQLVSPDYRQQRELLQRMRSNMAQTRYLMAKSRSALDEGWALLSRPDTGPIESIALVA